VRILAAFAKFLLYSFAIALGVGVASVVIYLGYERHANAARDLRQWEDKSFVGYRVALKTEWLNQAVQYQFAVQPADSKLADNFEPALESANDNKDRFGITLSDKGGFPLCTATVNASDFLRSMNDAGKVTKWYATGRLNCSSTDYRQAADWSPDTTFPRLSEARPNPPQGLLPTRRPKPALAGWRSRANWRKLRQGMTQAEVKALLGPPGSIDNSLGFSVWWLYPDILGGRVEFNRDGGVTGWSEPSHF
jgi:hypothetical protein